MRLVFDIEANGLQLEEVTQVHCLAAIDLDSDREWKYGPQEIDDALHLLSGADSIIGHNIIDYDLPVLLKLHNFSTNARVIDTLVISRLLYPDRKKPIGLIGKAGPHSIESWGHRFGTPKVVHEDWSVFSEEMMERCIVDTRIQKRLYFELYKEAIE